MGEGCDFEITEQKVSCPSPKDETNTENEFKSGVIKEDDKSRTGKRFRRKHRKREELDNEPLQKCDLCDYVPKIPNINSIRVHREAQHLGVGHDCPHCAKTWTTRSNMQKHVVEAHSSNVPVDIKSDAKKEVAERRTGLKTKRTNREVLKAKKREMSQLEELELELEEEKSAHIEVGSLVEKEVEQRRKR